MFPHHRPFRERGQSLIEFAMILILLLILVSGLVVFGQILRAYLIITNASREGARYGVAGYDNAGIENVIRNRTLSLGQDTLAWTIEPTNEQDREIGQPLSVEVRYGVPLWVPIYSMALPNPFPLRSLTVMPYEADPRSDFAGPGSGGDEAEGAIQPGDFQTQSQGGWGSPPQGNNPGALLDIHFSAVFPSGLKVGSGFRVLLTSPAAVRNLLPTGGPAGMLTQDATDPTRTDAGVLMGHITALAINVAFSDAGVLPQKDDFRLGDLVLAEGPFVGQNVDTMLQLAQQVMGGDPSGLSSFGASITDLNDAIAKINSNFSDGTGNQGYLRLP